MKSTTLAAGLLLATMAGGTVAAQQMPLSRFHGGQQKEASILPEASGQKKVMKRLTSGGSTVYGYIGYDRFYDDGNFKDTNIGALCNFGPTNYTIKWTDPMWLEEMSVLRTGYYYYDKELDKYLITGTNPVYYTGNPDIISVCLYTYDFETGKFMGAQFPTQKQPYFLCAAYNEDDGYVYGLAEYLPAMGGGAYYGRAKLSNLSSIQQLAPLDDNHAFVSICWNCDDGLIYGMLSDGRLMRVEEDGKTTTKVAQFSERIGPWQTGLAYSPVEKLFYWNANFENGRSAFYSIDINEGEAGMGKFNYLYDFDNDEEFYFFITTDKKADGKAPAVASVGEVNFPNGATSGSISFVTPTKLADGSDIPAGASLRYQAFLDGADYSGGSAKPGETITLEFIELPEEVHNFSFTTSLEGKQSLATARELFIGVDTPVAPENVYLTEERVTWEAVTDGVHGGWINRDDLEYYVYVDGEFYGKTKDMQLDIEIPETLEIHNFCATVVAVAGGKESAPGISNYIVAGNPLTLPVFFAPTADDAVACTYIDYNGDGNGWVYSAPSEAWVCLHSLRGEGDDWLFLPPMKIQDASKYYVLSFDSKIVNDAYPKEYMTVMAGKELNPDGMTITIKPKFTPGVDYTNYEALLKVDDPGTYYVAFHYVSDEMQNGIYLKNVGIAADGLDAATPAYVQNLAATPGEKGALDATITFNMPELTIGGEKIPADTELTAVVAAENTLTLTGKPGEAMSAKVSTLQGMNMVKVQVSRGENTGLAAPINVWTGIDVPSKVTNLKAEDSRDMMSVHLSWDAPEVGLHDGWVGDGPFTYDIYRYMPSPLFGMSWEKVGSAGTETEYTYIFESGAEQDLYPFGVRPSNSAGKPTYVTITAQMAGTPHALPMDENFENYETDFTYLPWIVMNPDMSYTGNWNVTPVGDYDSRADGFLFVASGARGTKAQVAAPRFSTKGMKAVQVYFELFGGEEMTSMDLLASTYGSTEPVKIGEVPVNKKEGFYSASVMLPEEYLDKYWVALYYDVTFGNNANLFALRRMLVGDPASSEMIADNEGVTVVSGEGTVTVCGAEGQRIDVYAADGRIVASTARAAQVETFRLDKGIYIVRGVKVAVR